MPGFGQPMLLLRHSTARTVSSWIASRAASFEVRRERVDRELRDGASRVGSACPPGPGPGTKRMSCAPAARATNVAAMAIESRVI